MRIRGIMIAIAVITLVILARCQCAVALGDDPVQNVLNRFQRETKCKNVSVVIYNHGEFVYYGDKDVLYQIGSMTKAFTGLAVRKLIQDGMLSEKDALTEFVPELETYFASEKVDVTIQNLLEQKSGFTNDERTYPGAAPGESLADWAKRLSGRKLNSQPGTEYAYSNVNYNLLGLIIERTSGMTYEEYVKKEILEPLGLGHTSVGEPMDGDVAEGMRLGYRQTFPFHLPVREASIPAGYFYSSAKDVGRWMESWMGKGNASADLEKAMESVKERLAETGDYDSGWERFSDGVIGHSGGTPNYSSRIVFSVEDQVGVCALTNLNVAASTDSLCNGLFDLVRGKGEGALATDVWTVFDAAFSVVTALGAILFVAAFWMRRKPLWIGLDLSLVILLVLTVILLPIIFGAGLKAILLTWAPWSLAGGLLTLTVDVLWISLKLWMGKKHAGHNETK